MRGLIVDYYGVLDGPEEDRSQWRKLLTAAKNNGISVAMLSNIESEQEAAQIRSTWGDYFDKLLFSGEIGYAKPEHEAFEYAAEQLGLSVNSCVMVDDNILNIRAAVETGLVGILYQHFDRVSVEIDTIFNLESGGTHS